MHVTEAQGVAPLRRGSSTLRGPDEAAGEGAPHRGEPGCRGGGGRPSHGPDVKRAAIGGGRQRRANRPPEPHPLLISLFDSFQRKILDEVREGCRK
nr:unnamed protein product [Digitaria exilis]